MQISLQSVKHEFRFGLKWFTDFSWFPTTEQEILAVYEAAVPTKISPSRVYKYCFVKLFRPLRSLQNWIDGKLFVYNIQFSSTSTKQLKHFCLEMSDIKTM